MLLPSLVWMAGVAITAGSLAPGVFLAIADAVPELTHSWKLGVSLTDRSRLRDGLRSAALDIFCSVP